MNEEVNTADASATIVTTEDDAPSEEDSVDLRNKSGGEEDAPAASLQVTMGDDRDSSVTSTSSGGGAAAAASDRRGQSGRRRLAFGRVTTHPFDARQPSTLRFDHEATVSEPAADRWGAFFTVASKDERRRRGGHRAGSFPSLRKRSSPTSSLTDQSFLRVEGLRAGHEPDLTPPGASQRSSIVTLQGVLDEVTVLGRLTSRAMSQSSFSHETDGVESLPTAPDLDPPVHENSPCEMGRPSRRRRGIQALSSDPLRAAKGSPIHDKKAEELLDLDERPRRTSLHEVRSRCGGMVEHGCRRAPEREEEPSGLEPRIEVTRVAPPRQVGRRGSTLSSFLRGDAKNPSTVRKGHVEGLTPLTLDDARVHVVSDRGSTQESESEDDVGQGNGDIPMTASPRHRFGVPVPRRMFGAKSCEHGATPMGTAESANRSSMVTNLPSRRFSLAPTNPWYRRKDGLQATHGPPSLAACKGNSRRWTLVSILPSRKSRLASQPS